MADRPHSECVCAETSTRNCPEHGQQERTDVASHPGMDAETLARDEAE